MLLQQCITFVVFFFLLNCKEFATSSETYPYHVSVEKLGKHICSGTIISPTVVLTTASCLQDVEVSEVRVRAGTGQLEDGGILKSVKEMIVHKRYLQRRKDYDVALIILTNELQYSPDIQAIELPKESSQALKQGTKVLLSSWGLDENELSDELKGAELKITVPIDCKNAYAPLFIYITDRMFCAELINKHDCKGDSGSPLVFDNVLLGISAWEQKCGNSKFPGIYTNVANLRRWIETQANLS